MLADTVTHAPPSGHAHTAPVTHLQVVRQLCAAEVARVHRHDDVVLLQRDGATLKHDLFAALLSRFTKRQQLLGNDGQHLQRRESNTRESDEDSTRMLVQEEHVSPPLVSAFFGESTSTLMRLNSSRHAHAPDCARPENSWPIMTYVICSLQLNTMHRMASALARSLLDSVLPVPAGPAIQRQHNAQVHSDRSKPSPYCAPHAHSDVHND